MNETTKAVIQATFNASNQGRIHFGEVVAQLVAAGVESYSVDYRLGRTTYFLPNGATVDHTFERAQDGVSDAFDGDEVRAAILGAQQGRVMYPEFKQRTQLAGCAGYTVWIAGRHVTYYGRRGETHVERFPN